MESFYHSLKTEMVYFMKFKHLTEAIAHIMYYISFYNYKRLHSGLGYIADLADQGVTDQGVRLAEGSAPLISC